MTRLFSILLAIGLVLILSTTVLNSGYAGLRVGTSLGTDYAIGSHLQREDAGSFNMVASGSYAMNHFLFDYEQGLDDESPSAVGFSYIVNGKLGDPQFYGGLHGKTLWLVDETKFGLGAQLGTLLPAGEEKWVRIGLRSTWYGGEDWRAGFEGGYVITW